MTTLVVILVTILFSAFFSGMEIAYVSANKLRLEIDKKQHNINAKILAVFTNNPSQFISTMLVGNNLALVIYGIFMAHLLEPVLSKYVASNFNILLLQTIISTIVILFTAEFIPKTLFRIINNSALKIFALPLAFFYYLFYPLVKISIGLSKFILQIFGSGKVDSKNPVIAFGKVDIDYTINEYSEETVGVDSYIENDIKIFQNALDFSDIILRECMVPRTELFALPSDADIEDLRKGFIKSGYSRALIYKDTIDDIIGFVHILSIFKNPKKIRNIVNPLIFVPETMPARKLLEQFIQESKSMAVVVDEFGGTSGVVTIEDIMEEIFGEIEDEHDNLELIFKQISNTEYLFSGRVEIDLINEKYHLGLSENEDYETIGGYILFHYGDFPHKNQEIKIEDNSHSFYFRIIKMSDTRIDLIKLVLK
jgi:CBS domain containing-hemolysin-like protein